VKSRTLAKPHGPPGAYSRRISLVTGLSRIPAKPQNIPASSRHCMQPRYGRALDVMSEIVGRLRVHCYSQKEVVHMNLIFWLVAIILIVFGCIKLYARDFLWAAVLIVLGLVVYAISPGAHIIG
jgi:hypothetical protein